MPRHLVDINVAVKPVNNTSICRLHNPFFTPQHELWSCATKSIQIALTSTSQKDKSKIMEASFVIPHLHVILGIAISLLKAPKSQQFDSSLSKALWYRYIAVSCIWADWLSYWLRVWVVSCVVWIIVASLYSREDEPERHVEAAWEIRDDWRWIGSSSFGITEEWMLYRRCKNDWISQRRRVITT